MADPVYLLLIVLHVASAAAMFGVMLPIASLLGRAANQGTEAKRVAAQTARRANKIAWIVGLIAFSAGLALIFYKGGMKAVAPTIHSGMAAMMLLLVLVLFIERPLLGKLEKAAEGDEIAWLSHKKRFAMGHGIQSLLWLIILGLMFAG